MKWSIVEGNLEVKLPTIWIDEKQRWEELEEKNRREKEDQRRERVRRKKMQMREKVGKSRNTVFFQWFVAPEGRKVGSLKRRVRSQLARWKMKNCTPLWCEKHFEVKMVKTSYVRVTFGSWDVEKAHAVVMRSTFWSQNVKNTICLRHFWKLRYRKIHAIVTRSTFRSQNVQKHHMYAPLLEVQMSFCVAGARDFPPCQKWAKCEGFVAFPKRMAGVGHLKRNLQRCIFRGRRNTRDIFIGAVRRWGGWFPARGCILEH